VEGAAPGAVTRRVFCFQASRDDGSLPMIAHHITGGTQISVPKQNSSTFAGTGCDELGLVR
jgi:hypothetical protein